MLNIHHIQHVPFEGMGSIEIWAHQRECVLTSTHLYRNESFPDIDSLDWLIVMGGPMNIYETDLYPWLTKEKRFIEQAIERGKTVLGICLGAQLIADVMGSKVFPGKNKEIGWFPVTKTGKAKSIKTADFLSDEIEVFHWHGDTFNIPDGAVHIARSSACESQGFIYDNRVVGLQFHLETTVNSAEALIKNCGNELVPGSYIQTADEILSDMVKFKRINAVMESLLDSLC